MAVLAAGCSGSNDTTSASPPPTDQHNPDENATPADTDPDTEPATDSDSDPASETLETQAREFIELQMSGLFVDAYDGLTMSFAAEFSIDEIRQGWQQMVTTSGRFGSIAAVNYTETTDGLARVTVETTFNDVRNTFTIFIDPSSGIEGYHITDQSEYDWTPPPSFPPVSSPTLLRLLTGTPDRRCQAG
ncbi:MAG: hypothetical protein J07HX5_01480 [halophilic archaeon J07HX5]|nr:MAG: hypothetical protein J07HX5_01480 [halophilic archaeon J07HX5]